MSETTMWYECSTCHQACNLQYPQTTAAPLSACHQAPVTIQLQDRRRGRAMGRR